MRKTGTFNKIAIVGVGLIGGSIGLAVKRRRLAKEVIGVFRRSSSLRKALRAKAVDRGTLDLREGVTDADLVMVATPVGRITAITEKITGCMKTGSIITDAGSVKAHSVKTIERFLPKRIYFVGGHPMAGSEKAGVAFARKDLFQASLCILVKTARTDKRALKKVADFWKALGASVIVMTPPAHDRKVAQVSHLPHIIAQSLCLSVDEDSLLCASGSFRDMTRVAFLNTAMWMDIFKANRRNLLSSIDHFMGAMRQIRADLLRSDFTSLKKKAARAARIRQAILKKR